MSDKKGKMNKKEVLKIIGITAVTVILVCMLISAFLMGALGGVGPFSFVKEMRLEKMEGNAEQYHLEETAVLEDSPLEGKNLCFLGSSVTEGASSLHVSFADYIAKRNSCDYVKEAVGGTTLVDNGENSYIQRMLGNISTDEEFDAFICQLSTNDAQKDFPLGDISKSKDQNDFDTSTIIGAMEYIISYAQETWDCPVVFYTGTKFDSGLYAEMVDSLYELQDKWGIYVIDLWNGLDTEIEEYDLYMADHIHPTQAGYLEWWTPFMEEQLYEICAD